MIPLTTRFLQISGKFLKSSGGAEVIGGAITKNQLARFKASVNAASIVFMHSALDGAASDLCRLTVLVAPLDWQSFISGQKVMLADARRDGNEVLFQGQLQDHLNALERESLLKRVERLFAVCKPSPQFIALDNAEPNIEFMLNTGMFLISLVNERYDVRLDPAFIPDTAYPRSPDNGPIVG
jgi:hypothetical protein